MANSWTVCVDDHLGNLLLLGISFSDPEFRNFGNGVALHLLTFLSAISPGYRWRAVLFVYRHLGLFYTEALLQICLEVKRKDFLKLRSLGNRETGSSFKQREIVSSCLQYIPCISNSPIDWWWFCLLSYVTVSDFLIQN